MYMSKQLGWSPFELCPVCQKRHMTSPKSPAVEVQPKLDTEINENK